MSKDLPSPLSAPQQQAFRPLCRPTPFWPSGSSKAVLNLLILAQAVMPLAACKSLQPPPAIVYDSEDPADETPLLSAEPPAPVEIVTIPEPLPLPGQLKPLASAPADSRKSPGQIARARQSSLVEQITAAQRGARYEPAVDGYVNAIQVYPYTEGALYRLYAKPEQVSDIALEPGEKLIAVSAGDTLRWVLGDTTSGSGLSEQVHILIKPIAAGLSTNLVITTDRRTYHLELESREDVYMAALSWRYPQDELLLLRRRNQAALQMQAVDQGLDLQRLRFRYAISGDTPPWRPLRAFDDGRKVYIEFPRRIDQGEAPPLFLIAPNGEAALTNYRMRGHYYIVDRLFAAAELRLGEAPQQIVRISRTDQPATVGENGGG